MYSVFLSMSTRANLFTVSSRPAARKWDSCVLPCLRQGRGAVSLWKQGTDTKSSLFCSLWALESSPILPSLLPAVCRGRGAHSCPSPWVLQVPAAASSPPALFLPARCREKDRPATTQSLHQHPSSTDSFWTKIGFPRFCFFPAPSCFVCLGGGSLFSWSVEACLLCCFLGSLSQPHNLAPFHHLVLASGPCELPGQQPSCFLSSSGGQVTQQLRISWVLLLSFSKLGFFHLYIFLFVSPYW